jgi:hypothetical protein
MKKGPLLIIHNSLFIVVFAITFFLSTIFPNQVNASHTTRIFPKRANYFLWREINEDIARELSRWDLVILDMETQINSRPYLELIRRLNPDIKMLVYITSQEIDRTAPISGSRLRQKLAAQIDPRWYAVDTNRKKQSFWPGTWLLNMSADAPSIDGKQMNKLLAEFVANELLATGLWDGVFYDNAFDSIAWVTGKNVDFNLDRKADANPDQSWREGMKFLYDETRRLTNNQYLIVGNGITKAYRDHLDGLMLENFAGQDWTGIMRTYDYLENKGQSESFNIVNANTSNLGGEDSYQSMRFGLASALLADGYFSFDYGDKDHGQLWYYDEYDLDLGPASTEVKSVNGGENFSKDVWRRDFHHGIALVNSTDQAQTVGLGGEFEAIRGLEDKVANNGAIVSELDLAPKDGRVLLKTLDELEDVFFRNGDFVRFLRPDGSRVRNGFFVFDTDYPGGTQIAKIDFTGDGKRELVVVTENKISVYRDDGQLYMRRYPYTANYKGQLQVAAGDITGNGKYEIVVAPTVGYPVPIKIYTRHGIQLNHDWFPFGTGYTGGYSVATADIRGYGRDEIVLGAGIGQSPRVRIYRYAGQGSYNLLYNWLAFGSSFFGGINVSAGDIDNDFFDEIVVGAGPGKGPVIRIFEANGNQIGEEITAYTALGRPGIDVEVVDVDFDGKADIVAMSGGI